jgi:hypothetical protein
LKARSAQKDGKLTCKTTTCAGSLAREKTTKLFHDNFTSLFDLELENTRRALGGSSSGIIFR